MRNERNALKAGLFMIISLALIIGVIIGIKGFGRLTEENEVRTVTFGLSDNIGGLRIGDDVRVGGLKVGVVKDLEFQEKPQDGSKPRITVWITIPTRIP